ncbi:hypothetical protein D9M68_946050 [compost metagenome]
MLYTRHCRVKIMKPIAGMPGLPVPKPIRWPERWLFFVMPPPEGLISSMSPIVMKWNVQAHSATCSILYFPRPPTIIYCYARLHPARKAAASRLPAHMIS